ncbi:hypothetical protein [Chelativorans sp. AA-79]|uniref:hypothetical protein n=1 Tax=Chelativorans sp. AA-79 TaxID=3028735 RepID=UPI0023F8B92C|nr:hypothetical protein [Chelativorans sp. AA-79]WEX07535.1 hypothetical protein PVE73_15595 [Chelativorans sp. AA-79]
MPSFMQSWEAYRPSKAVWLWSCVGTAVATMIVGFTVGGWTTGGTATEMAQQARSDARAELVASLCVNKFITSANAEQNLAKLKEASSWERDDFISEGGWSQFTGLKEQVEDANDLCADQLVAMEELPARADSPVAQPARTEG